MLTHLADVQAALLALKTVKDVHPEKRLTRSLQWGDAVSENDVGASLSHCSLLQKGSSIDGSIAKRPGRCSIRLNNSFCPVRAHVPMWEWVLHMLAFQAVRSSAFTIP